MKFKYIYIENYRCFKNFELSFDNYNSLYKKLYNNMNLNVIIGENGSGKSTLMSFIANVFHNLERFPERISSSFSFTYNLHKIPGDITLNFSYPQLEIINQDNIFKFNFKKSKDTILLNLFKKPEVAYEEYKFLLPEIVSVSNFSLDSFFPKNFPSNYIGDRNVYFNTIDAPTVINKYSLNLSRGTILFFNKYKSNSFKTKLKEILNLEFCDYVSFVSKTSHLEDSVIENIYYKNFKDINPFFTLKSFKTALKKNIFFKDFTSLLDIFSSCYKLNLKKLVSHNHFFYFNLLLTFAEMECIYINDIFIKKENTISSFLDMSSGEKSFIYRVLGSLSNAYDDSIIIFDELETHLNTVWSRQILWFLKELFSDFSLHMFISTHSYLFINSVFNENLIFLKNFKQKKIVEPIFLANESEIFKMLFPEQNIFSAFEEDVITYLSAKDIEKNFDIFGNSYIKFLLFNQLKSGELKK